MEHFRDIEGLESWRILDVGCGKNKFKGAVGLDYNPRTDADVVHDLNEFPYPFEDDAFDMVYASHLVEHVENVIAFFEELSRITRHGGIIRIITPHYTNPDWNCDPTHRHHFSSYSFRTMDRDKRHFDFYTNIDLKMRHRKVTVQNLWWYFGLEFLINIDNRARGLRFLRKFWEHYLCYILRGKDMYFDFEVVKET